MVASYAKLATINSLMLSQKDRVQIQRSATRGRCDVAPFHHHLFLIGQLVVLEAFELHFDIRICI
jgi:hypothetical protein